MAESDGEGSGNGDPPRSPRGSRDDVPHFAGHEVPMVEGQSVWIWHRVPEAARGAWFAGVLVAVSADQVVAGYADPHVRYCEELSGRSARLRLHARTTDAPGVSDDFGAVPYPVSPLSEITAYRSVAHVLARASDRRRDEATAMRRAAAFFVLALGGLRSQLRLLGGRLDSRPLFLEYFSGPYRSASHALQVCASGGPAAAVCAGRGTVSVLVPTAFAFAPLLP